MLKLEDFSLNKGSEIILEAKDFELNSGQMVLLLGKNSSGKSLFLKTIHNEYEDFNGEIFIKERSLFSAKRRNTIFVERDSKLLKDKTIYENITLTFSKVKNRTKKRIAEACELINLKHDLDEIVDNISYSERKKIELIRAAIQNPYIILIDDINTFFDEINLVNFFKLYNKMAASGILIIAASTTRINHFDKYFRIDGKSIEEI